MDYFVMDLQRIFQSVLVHLKRTIVGNDMDGTVKISESRENSIIIDFEDGNSYEVIIHQTHAPAGGNL